MGHILHTVSQVCTHSGAKKTCQQQQSSMVNMFAQLMLWGSAVFLSEEKLQNTSPNQNDVSWFTVLQWYYLRLKSYTWHIVFFLTIFTRETTYMAVVFFSCTQSPSENGNYSIKENLFTDINSFLLEQPLVDKGGKNVLEKVFSGTFISFITQKFIFVFQGQQSGSVLSEALLGICIVVGLLGFRLD